MKARCRKTLRIVTVKKKIKEDHAVITFKRQVYYLGSYAKIEDAAQVRKLAEDHLFGSFLDWYYAEYPDVKRSLQNYKSGSGLCEDAEK